MLAGGIDPLRAPGPTMATIGIVVAALPGHLLPIGALGRELVRRGHRVVAATLPDGEPPSGAAGLDFAPIGGRRVPAPARSSGSTAELGRRRGRAAFRHTIELGARPDARHPARRPRGAPPAPARPAAGRPGAAGRQLARRAARRPVRQRRRRPAVRSSTPTSRRTRRAGARALALGAAAEPPRARGPAVTWRGRSCGCWPSSAGPGGCRRATTRATGPRPWPRSGSSRGSSSSPAACRRTSTASAR